VAGIVYINEEEGKKRLMDNSRLYAKILAKFAAGTNLDDILAFCAGRDWEKAAAAAHAVKGIAANLSLTELYNQSLDVETQLKGGALEPASLENLKACFAETLTQAEKVIAKYA